MEATNSSLIKLREYYRFVLLTVSVTVFVAASQVAPCAAASPAGPLPVAESNPGYLTTNSDELPATEKPDYGTVWGYVGDPGGDPIAGALVVVKGTNRFATTNAKGYYVISPVPAGTFEIKASRIGYGEAKRTDVKITAGRKTNVNFVLGANSSFPDRTKGMIEGHVVDVTGYPLERIRVRVLGSEASVETDGDGSFSLGPIAPGFYSVRAEGSAYLFQTARVLVVGGEVTPLQFVLWADRSSIKFGL
jgi:hypothetical protein